MKLRRVLLASSAVVYLLFGAPTWVCAYDPGSGTLYSDGFEGELDPDWERGNGFGSPSPWTQAQDGSDTSFLADGLGPWAGSPTRHWARHYLHPVRATSFSLAFEYRSELGASYVFDLEVEQRAPTLRKIRMRIDGDGNLSLWRSENGVLVNVAATGSGFIPPNARRWIRLAIEDDLAGGSWLRVRVWGGSATLEPSNWNLEYLDSANTLVRVHRFEIIADGPKGIDTYIDDLDAFGDAGAGADSTVKKIYVMEMSHLDIGFTEPPDDIEIFARTHLDSVLQNLDLVPEYRWMIETGWWFDRWWETADDGRRNAMLSHLKSGRLSLAASYVNLHTTKVGYEELSRSVYWSSRMAAKYDFPLRTFITDDVPGSTFALPELLARSGIEFFVGGMNTSFGGRVIAPGQGDRPFWWEGPDGSRVLAWTTFDSYAEGFQWGFSFFDKLEDLYDKLGRELPKIEESGYPFPEMLLMRGFDNHYQDLHVRNLVDQWNATYETPVFVLATPEEFFDFMLATYGADSFPVYSGDYGAAWSGSNAGPAHTQRRVRSAHRDARSAEALLAAASILDAREYPHGSVDRMYRRMLESDEHTGAGGWPGYFTPEEMQRNNEIHLSFATEAADTASALLSDGLDRMVEDLSAVGDAIVVYNTLGRARTTPVRQVLPQELFDRIFRIIDRRSGEEVLFQKDSATLEVLFIAQDLPSMGYAVFDVVDGEPGVQGAGVLDIGETYLENDFYRLDVDPQTGAVTGIFDKARGRELIDLNSTYAFNELASNVKQEYDAQSPPVALPPSNATTAVSSSGPIMVELKISRQGSAHTESRYRLYRGIDRVEIVNVLSKDEMPYVPYAVGTRAYTVTMPFDTHDFEIRSESTTRFLDPVKDSFARSTVFDWHNVEHTLAFWDGNGGVLYAVDNAVAHHFENLSSLTSPSYSNSDALVLTRMKDRADEYEFEDGSIGPYEIEPGTSPFYEFSHHIRGTSSGFDPLQASAFGFGALTTAHSRLLQYQPGNLPDAVASSFYLDTDGVLLYTLKRARSDQGLVLRLMEMEGQARDVQIGSDLFEIVGAEHVEQDEEGGAPLPIVNEKVSLSLGAYETATLRLDLRTAWLPITLLVDKMIASQTVELQWSGGNSPYTLYRAKNPQMTEERTVLQDEGPETVHSDVVLDDGMVYFYLVR